MTKKSPDQSRTELNSLGEFGLIDHLTKNLSMQHASSRLGVGDDAAAVDPGSELMLISTDMLLEGIHFDLAYTPLQHLGYKAVAVNISDIAAMNGICRQITFSIGLSNRFSLEAVETLYHGVHKACKNYQVDLIGGDTTSSHSGLVISVTAIGRVEPEKLITRSGARINDLVCVSGDLGAAYVGLQVLEREKQVFLTDSEMQPQLEAYEYLIKRQLTAEARTDLVDWFTSTRIMPSAMMDISDGLASDLIHICRQSKVGARIYQEKLPIDPATIDAALEFNLDPTTCALNGGEDYELLFTAGQEHYQAIEAHGGITVIGHIMEPDQGVDLVLRNGDMTAVTSQGWRHF